MLDLVPGSRTRALLAAMALEDIPPGLDYARLIGRAAARRNPVRRLGGLLGPAVLPARLAAVGLDEGLCRLRRRAGLWRTGGILRLVTRLE